MSSLRGLILPLAVAAVLGLLPAGLGRANPGFIPSSRPLCVGESENLEMEEVQSQTGSGKNVIQQRAARRTMLKRVLRVTIWRSDDPFGSKHLATCKIFRLEGLMLSELQPDQEKKLFVHENKKPVFGGSWNKDFVRIVEKGAKPGTYLLRVAQDDGSGTGWFEFRID